MLHLGLSCFLNGVPCPEKDARESIVSLGDSPLSSSPPSSSLLHHLPLLHILPPPPYLPPPCLFLFFLFHFWPHRILICLHHKFFFFLNFTDFFFTCLLESPTFGNRQNMNIGVNIYSHMHVHTIWTLRGRHALGFFLGFLWNTFNQIKGFAGFPFKLFREL